MENFISKEANYAFGNECVELGNPLEDFSAGEDWYRFDENEGRYMEDTLYSEGITDTQDFASANLEDLVDAVDKRASSLKPELKSKLNMGYFGKESDVWKEFRSFLEPKYLEAPSDKVQQEQIASAMYEMEDLRHENWTDLSLKGKVKLLNELEQKIAAIEHRPASNIRSEQMEPDLMGYQLDGDIALNESVLELSDVKPEIRERVFETLLHEGRHAYQHYNVEERMVHQSAAEVETWRENMQVPGLEYASGEPVRIPLFGNFTYTNEGLAQIGARLYYYQPLEIDARVFAADAMSEYRKKLNA